MEPDPGMQCVDQDSEVGVYSVTLTSPGVQPTQLRTVGPPGLCGLFPGRSGCDGHRAVGWGGDRRKQPPQRTVVLHMCAAGLVTQKCCTHGPSVCLTMDRRPGCRTGERPVRP